MLKHLFVFCVLLLNFSAFSQESSIQNDSENITSSERGNDSLRNNQSVVVSSAANTSILLISGDRINDVVIDSVNNEFIFYRKKERQHKTDVAKVFSFTTAGSETIMYTQDSIVGNELSVEQMNQFILGEQTAKLNYKSTATIVSSAILGGASGALSFWGVPVPLAYSLTLNFFSPKADKIVYPRPENKNEFFDAGYKAGLKNKKLKTSIISGLSSFATFACIIAFAL